MAERRNRDKKADGAKVEPVSWFHTDGIVRHLSTFLGPSDLCNFRLVCKKWKKESSSTWEDYRMRYTLNRFSEFGIKPAGAVNNEVDKSLKSKSLQMPELTVFKKGRPRFMDCDFDCVGAEGLRDFFLGAKKDDAFKDRSFRVVKLRKWNRFASFPSGEQEGAEWFMTEVADKIKHLTLDICNLSISQGDFFPALGRMTQLERLTIRGTNFQLRLSHPVEPSLAEISPLPDLKVLDMNYEKCTTDGMPNYYFPWHLILRAMPKMEVLILSYSTWKDLCFADQQFSKLLAVLKELKKEEKITGLTAVIFRHLAKPDYPIIPKKDVLMTAFVSMMQLEIRGQPFRWDESECVLPANSIFEIDFIDALVGSTRICVKFEDREGNNMKDPDAEENGQDKDLRVEPVNYDHDRTSAALLRASFVSSKFITAALGTADCKFKYISSNLKPEELLTVFQRFRPTQDSWDWDTSANCVGAEEVYSLFLDTGHATTRLKELTHLSFAFISLTWWNYFGNLPSAQKKVADWFLNEISDKVMYLTLDECSLSMSHGQFFPTLSKFKRLKHLTIRATHFYRSPYFRVHLATAEISPLPYLLNLELNYDTLEDKPEYDFRWDVLLPLLPNLYSVEFSYANRGNLDLALKQFYNMLVQVKSFQVGEFTSDGYLVSFDHLAVPNADASILKDDVIKMVSAMVNKVGVPVKKMKRSQFKRLYPQMSSIEVDLMAHVKDCTILLRIRKLES